MSTMTDPPKADFRLSMLINDTRYRSLTFQVIAAIAIALVFVDFWLMGLAGAAPLILVASLSCIFSSVNVIDLYFQSVVALRYVVLARQIQLWTGVLLRVALVLLEADLIWFAWLKQQHCHLQASTSNFPRMLSNEQL